MPTAAEVWRDKVLGEQEPALTVKELRRLLWGVPDDFVVYSEGCDCTDEAGGIDLDTDKYIVVVRRKRY